MDEKIIFSMCGVGKTLPHNNKTILKDIYLSFFYGAKIGIIGLNGSGKSTLLKIIAGVETGYKGEVVWSPGYSVGYLEQEPQMDPDKTVLEVVQEGVQETMDLLAEYNEIGAKFCEPMSDEQMNSLIERQGELTEKIDHCDGWEIDARLERAMDALQCPPSDALVRNLSGGERRRVALCRLLLSQPDVLLLDEPTNHLDLASREALEAELSAFPGTVVFVSHDRYFINAVATRVFLLYPDGLEEFTGNYDGYLQYLKDKEKKEPATPAEKTPSKVFYEAQKGDHRTKEDRQALAKAKNRVRELETEISALEKEQAELTAAVSDPENAKNYALLQEKCAHLSEIEEKMSLLLEEWENLSSSLDQ